MRNSNFETIDTLIKHIHFETMGNAEQQLVALYGRRYLDYRQQWQLAGELKYEPEFPLYIMLEQTYRCNMRCVSCIHGYPELREKYALGVSCMPWDLYERIVLEGEEHNCPSISTHNNDEPLLVKDLAKRIAFARKHGFMDVIMATNGVLFNEDKIREIIDAGVTRILFSIDALTEETYNKVRPVGSLKRVLWALEKAKEYRESNRSNLPILRASFVVTRINQHELEQFLDEFSALVDYIDVQPFLKYYDANVDLIPKGTKLVTNFCCSAPWRTLIVRGNGDVLPCPNFYGTELVMGNVYRKTLTAIFSSDSMKQLREDCKKGYYRNLACAECSRSIYEMETGRNQ